MIHVYFMRRADGTGPIKIGHSHCPAARAQSIGRKLKTRVTVLASAIARRCDERRLHRQFADHRQLGEWFAPAPEIFAAIEYTKTYGALPPVPADDRDALIADQYRIGASVRQVAASFCVSEETVRKAVTEAGIALRGHARRPLAHMGKVA